jgi:hypothetical protein
MAFDVARATTSPDAAADEQPKTVEGASGQTALVPPATPDDGTARPGPPAPGERPRLRRVK